MGDPGSEHAYVARARNLNQIRTEVSNQYFQLAEVPPEKEIVFVRLVQRKFQGASLQFDPGDGS